MNGFPLLRSRTRERIAQDRKDGIGRDECLEAKNRSLHPLHSIAARRVLQSAARARARRIGLNGGRRCRIDAHEGAAAAAGCQRVVR